MVAVPFGAAEPRVSERSTSRVFTRLGAGVVR